MLLRKGDHAGRIFLLASIIALMIVLTGAFAVVQTAKVQDQFVKLAQKDIPFLSDGARVTMLLMQESDILERAMRVGEEYSPAQAGEMTAELQADFKHAAEKISEILDEGQRLAMAAARRRGHRDDAQVNPYLEYLFRARREHAQFVARSNQMLALLARGDRISAQLLYPATAKEEDDLREVFWTAMLANQKFADQAIGRVEDGQASTLRGLLFITAIATLVGLWMIYLIRMVVRARRHAEAKLEHLAIHDSLTGLFNRHHLLERLEEQIRATRRRKRPLSICLCDLDCFKQINDTHGHRLGDEVLRRFADTIRRTVRAGDIAGRYGGDEFVVIFPDTDARESRIVLERIRQRFEQEEFIAPHGGTFRLSATFGLADCLPEHEDENATIEAADQALYRAKNQGRNCVVVHEDSLVIQEMSVTTRPN